MRSFIASALAASLFLSLATPTGAESSSPPADTPWQRLGLMRVRDMTPFGLARLDFLPAHAIAATPGTYAVELNLSYQNTWARSDNVEKWLAQRGLSRAQITPADAAAIIGLPGDAYLVDGEYGLLDLTLHHRLNSHFGLYATVPYFFFNGAVLDDPIEKFHSLFGFSNSGREYVPFNRWQAIVDLQGTQLVINRPPENGFGDPVFGVRYSLKENPRKWNLVAEAAAKIARQDARTFISSGSSDYGLQLSYQRFFKRNALYATLSGVYHASPKGLGLADDRWIPTAIVGWETRLSQSLGMVVQLYHSESAVQNTPLNELTADKLQVTAGLQWLHRGNVLRFGLTENLANFNNTPDVGLTLSVARIFNSRQQ